MQILSHLLNRKLPVVIGHADLIAGYRVGDGNRRMPDFTRRDARQSGQIRRDCGMKVIKVGTAQGSTLLKHVRSHFERKPRIGTTNVGNETRMIKTQFRHG